MKTKQTINLYLDFEFTSLSPDAQPISLGIIASLNKRIINPPLDLSFYAEFSDYDISRCDDWVKENVVSKLGLNGLARMSNHPENSVKRPVFIKGDTQMVKANLKHFLDQFSDYEIQVVVDCGTWDWYHFLQLVAEWDEIPEGLLVDASCVPHGKTIEEFAKEWLDDLANSPSVVYPNIIPDNSVMQWRKIGLPKLPPNICPVPIDLNDIIAMKMDISPKEAFDICRETIGVGEASEGLYARMRNLNDSVAMNQLAKNPREGAKHNAYWDAIVIKACYDKLMK